ncbi:MAG: hypothetical protein U1D30_07765 [Planctomycetota bacterium]
MYETLVPNKMIGGQLGGLLEWRPTSTITILSETNWAGFQNVTDATNRYRLESGLEYFRASTGEDRISGLIEMGLYGTWKCNRWLEFRVGYFAFYFGT